MLGEAYYPPTMFISNDTPTTNPRQAVYGRSIGIQFLPPCWRLLPTDSFISFKDSVSWWGHTIHKLQGLVFNLCWKIWILIFLVENTQVLSLPNTPRNKAKNNSPRWFSLNVVAINFPINIEPLLKIAHPKKSIHHLHSRLNPHFLDPRTVSKGMQNSFQIPLVDGAPILIYNSPFCKTSLNTYVVMGTPP